VCDGYAQLRLLEKDLPELDFRAHTLVKRALEKGFGRGESIERGYSALGLSGLSKCLI
jgi:hypothetical protein